MQAGIYFVTICTQDRQCLFGEVVNGEMQLNDVGEIVTACRGEALLRPYTPFNIPYTASGTRSGSLGAIIQNFKSYSTRHINTLCDTPGLPVWQRNYYDHIIRNDADLDRIRHYIVTNPLQWDGDQLHPDNPSKW
jgi:REP element-mobilizing transposase RayT